MILCIDVCACVVLTEDKVMTLRVKHKENELLFTPSRETRKEGTEWLKALKKVRLQTVLGYYCVCAVSRVKRDCHTISGLC